MHALAVNSTRNLLSTNGTIAPAGAKDICFFFILATVAKVQGSNDAGVTWTDIAGSGTPFAAMNGTTDVGVLSLTNCRFALLRPVLTGGSAKAVVVRTGIRDIMPASGTASVAQGNFTGAATSTQPVYTHALQVQIDDPIAGTA